MLPDSQERYLLTDIPRQVPTIFVLAVRRPRYAPQCVVLRVILQIGFLPFRDRVRPDSANYWRLHSCDNDSASDRHALWTTFANLHFDIEQLARGRDVIDGPLNDESRVDVR